MAGHSQFKNIMHRKGKQDAVRSKLFSKLAREITVAAKMGMPDPAMNARLRAAVHRRPRREHAQGQYRARHQEGPGGDGENYDEVRYEGYGPGGVAVIVEALTDNRNRTAGEIRSYFTKDGGALGETGSVAFMFDRIGQIAYRAKAASEDAMMEAAIEAGADDVVIDDEATRSPPRSKALARSPRRWKRSSASRRNAKLIWRPQNNIAVDDEAGEKILRLIGSLEDNDDVQNVYANFEISDALVAKMGG